MEERVRGSDESVVVSAESMASDDVWAVIQSNIDVVNALFAELLESEEIPHDALLSYYVDYYMAQVKNGGFAQFVYNTGWKPAVIGLVKEGLDQIGARRHAALFAKGESLVAAPRNKLVSFLSSTFFGKNAERDRLNGISDAFYALDEEESLGQLNATWLKSRPGLVVIPQDQIRQRISWRASLIPDRDERLARARAAEPQYMKLIRALCDSTGHSLDCVAGGDPGHVYEGKPVLAWHFITDKGHHFMVEAGGKALMFAADSEEKIAELTVH